MSDATARATATGPATSAAGAVGGRARLPRIITAAEPPRSSDSRPRLLYIGGPDVHFRIDLMRVLRDRFRLAAAGSDPALADSFEAEELEFVPYRLRRGVSPLNDIASYADLFRVIRAWRPDIVHTFDTKPSVWGRLAARAAGVPVVIGTVPGRGSLHSARGLRAAILRVLLTLLERAACTTADLTVLQNLTDYRQLIAQGIVPSAKAIVVPGSGVRTDILTRAAVPNADRDVVRQAVGATDDDVIVTMISRVIRSKGVQDFGRAADLLRQRLPHVRCLLVGPDDRASVDRLTHEELREIRRSLHWLGERRDIRNVLAATDVFVLPTYLREGIPRALLEAASMSLPLISTSSPGCDEVVLDGVTGILIPPRDPAALASAILRLARDPGQRRRLGEAARRLAVERFDLSFVAGQLADIYLKLLRSSRPDASIALPSPLGIQHLEVAP